jgi:hypothetical protein
MGIAKTPLELLKAQTKYFRKLSLDYYTDAELKRNECVESNRIADEYSKLANQYGAAAELLEKK